MIDALLPHGNKRGRGQLIDGFPGVLDARKGVSPDRAFAPFLALFPPFISGAHRFPGDPLRIADVLRRSLHALLMDQ